jgi:predicted AAA+ superfamily ATPase
MAGRVGILQLESMTPLEMAGRGAGESWLGAYLERPDAVLDTVTRTVSEMPPLTRFLWRGTLPGVLDLPDHMVPAYMSSYVQTYLERDVRGMSDIGDLADFSRFLSLNAALTSQEINDSQIGREIGMSPTSARRWRDLLAHTYQWVELSPYHGNTIKRLCGKRKGHMKETGLACYLQRISSPDALLASPLLGALFESWAVSFVLQQSARLAVPPQIYHWRAAGGAEVDMVLERDARLYPIEVKCKSMPTGHDARGLRAFRETYGRIVRPGLILHAGTEALRLDAETCAIPWNAA